LLRRGIFIARLLNQEGCNAINYAKKCFGATVILALFLTGCDPNTVYNAYEDIDDGAWYVKKMYLRLPSK